MTRHPPDPQGGSTGVLALAWPALSSRPLAALRLREPALSRCSGTESHSVRPAEQPLSLRTPPARRLRVRPGARLSQC